MSRRDKLQIPGSDIEVAGSYEGSDRNLGNCTEATYNQIWAKYSYIYGNVYTERELYQRHVFWKRLASTL